MAQNIYTVGYRMNKWETEREVQVIAGSKYEAYDKVCYDPDILPATPYGAWVESVTYKNGNTRYFNTSQGNPY